MADTNWVDAVIARLEATTNGIFNVQVGGQKLSVVLGTEVVQYFKDNRVLLLKVGQELFCDFLLLIHEKKNEEAFQLLLSKMDAEDLIARMNMSAAELKDYNDTRDKFMASLRKFVISTLTSLASKVLVGLIIGAL